MSKNNNTKSTTHTEESSEPKGIDFRAIVAEKKSRTNLETANPATLAQIAYEEELAETLMKEDAKRGGILAKLMAGFDKK